MVAFCRTPQVRDGGVADVLCTVLFASDLNTVSCGTLFFTAITETVRSDPQFLKLAFDCLTHAIVTILSTQDSRL